MEPRFNLPPIDFIEVDAEELEFIGVSKFEELQNVSLSEADPRRKFIQSIAYVMAMISNNIDFTGKQSLLAYSTDNYLEHLGAKKNVTRLPPVAAKTIIRFDVAAPEAFIIPAGLRMSVNDLMFASEKDVSVTPDQMTVDIDFLCETPGTEGNGFLPGQISNIVDSDLVPWVSKAVNITKTEGGIDWETDDAFAERIRTSNERYSTAGPELAYVYYAKSANQKIIDVQVISPSPGVIEIFPLLEGGELPTDEIMAQVLALCSDKTVRPLTDFVKVSKPIVKSYDLEATYFLPKSSLVESEKEIVEAAFNDYVLWQRSKLGRGIDPSELYARLQNAGAKRIQVTPSNYIELERQEVAHAGTTTLTFGGFIDD